MRFGVLGPLVVENQGESVKLGGRRQQAVLALLLQDPGRVATSDWIISQIWPDNHPDDVRDSLYVYISQLRKAVAKERITSAGGGYRLDLLPVDEIDAVVFGDALTNARSLIGSDPDEAADRFATGLSLWRGRAYEGFEDISALALAAGRLEESRLAAIEDRTETELRVGRIPDTASISSLCEENPFRERLWGLFARSLYRAERQAEALGSLTRLRRVLADELGLEPSPETVRLEEQILLHDPKLRAEVPLPATNLPVPVSSFFGRVSESGSLGEAIETDRLVTIQGPGGAGKTRLAIEVSHRLLKQFPDGVWFVDLAQVPDAANAPRALLGTLRLGDQAHDDPLATAVAHLRSREALLVLDNCEHLADAVANLATELLEAAPRLKVLATSRVPLGCEGEVRFVLEGFSTSPHDQAPSEAAELFALRAKAANRHFAINEFNQAVVHSICESLDGMPLAIELAAARVTTLSLEEIQRHLADRFILLSQEPPSRPIHRSLLASLNWSYDLLSIELQEAFDALGVFEGPFSIDAAREVTRADAEVETANMVQSLVDASLLQVSEGAGPSTLYRLLETPRLYALEHLQASGHWNGAIERHDSHYSSAAAAKRQAFFGTERVAARREVESELAGYQSAFDRLLQRGDDAAMAMGWAMGQVWLFAGYVSEGERRLSSLVDRPSGKTNHRADALSAASFIAMYNSRYDESIARAEQAVGLYRRLGDDQGLAYALARGGHAAFSAGDGPSAVSLLQESIEVCRRVGYDAGLAWPITLLAQARRWAGDTDDQIKLDIEEGRRLFIQMGETYGQAHADLLLSSLYEEGVEYRTSFAEEMVRLSEYPGADRIIRSIALLSLANAVWDSGDRDRAEGLNRAAIRSAVDTGATVNVGLDLLQAATFSAHRGLSERCARLFGAGDRWFLMARAPFMEKVYGEAIELATDDLGEEQYRQLYEEGNQMGMEEAVAYALSF